jgi:DNA-directed RNA polymerase alpha subunit
MQKYLSLDIKKLLVGVLAVVMSVGLTAGLASASTGSIDTTGPGSDNSINYENETEVEVENETEVDADVDMDQNADSGDTEVEFNTTGGSAESGDAENDSYVEAALSIDNSSSSEAALSGNSSGSDDDGSIEMTGPESDNHITFSNEYEVEVENETDVDFDVDVDQDADTGDASVSNNTTGGDAVSGSASNTSTVVFTLDVVN